MAWDRYAYVGNEPMRRTDPSGHYYCEGGSCQHNIYHTYTRRQLQDEILSEYEVTLVGAWSEAGRHEIIMGVYTIGVSFPSSAQTSSAAFSAFYDPLTIALTDAGSSGSYPVCVGSGAGVSCSGGGGGISSRLISHELGHTFNATLENRGIPTSPYGVLGRAQILDELGFWVTGMLEGDWTRGKAGYGSEGPPDLYHGPNWDDWNTPNEEFADMFMNYVFDSFRRNAAGDARFSWMFANMPTWLAYR